MARITVEDCLEHVENRFSLVLIAAERTKQILRGASPLLDASIDNKEVVTALREVAAGLIKYHEKDPEEVPPEVATAEVRRAVALRELREQTEADAAEVQSVEPVDSVDDLDDVELDQIRDDFPDALDEDE